MSSTCSHADREADQVRGHVLLLLGVAAAALEQASRPRRGWSRWRSARTACADGLGGRPSSASRPRTRPSRRSRSSGARPARGRGRRRGRGSGPARRPGARPAAGRARPRSPGCARPAAPASASRAAEEDLERARAPRRSSRGARSARRRPASSGQTTTPSSESAWPARYLVAEWTTKSAPSAERALQQRRRERRVDGEPGAALVGGGAERGEVGDPDQRVVRRFGPDRSASPIAAIVASVSVWSTSSTSSAPDSTRARRAACGPRGRRRAARARGTRRRARRAPRRPRPSRTRSRRRDPPSSSPTTRSNASIVGEPSRMYS